MISIIVPSMYRPEQFRASIERLRETIKGFDVEIVAVVDGRCKPTLAVAAELQLLTIYNEKHLGALVSWNRGLRVCSGDYVVTIADDTYCHDNWLEEALKSHSTLPEWSGIVGLNPLWDEGYKKTHCCHFLADRKAIREVLGGVLFYETKYKHYCSDNETYDRAVKAGRYVASEKSVVEHKHWRHEKATKDIVYTLTEQYLASDYKVLRARRAAGYPNDFEPMI